MTQKIADIKDAADRGVQVVHDGTGMLSINHSGGVLALRRAETLDLIKALEHAVEERFVSDPKEDPPEEIEEKVPSVVSKSEQKRLDAQRADAQKSSKR